MRRTTKSIAGLSLMLLLASAIGACASVVPQRLRPNEETAVKSGKGSHVYVRLKTGEVVQGELIAASEEKLWILGSYLKAVPFQTIHAAAVGVFQTDETAYGAWTALGAVSTISHGAFLIFTFPLWLVAGIVASNHEANRGEIDGGYVNAETFGAYSRFPQGLPPGVDEFALRGLKPPAPRPALTPYSPVDAAAPLDPATRGD